MHVSGGRGCQAVGIASAKVWKWGCAFIFLSKSEETGVSCSRMYKRRSAKRCTGVKLMLGFEG